MEERAAEENEVVEKEGERKAKRMGSEAMDSSAHLADLAYPVPILPIYLADLAYPRPIYLLPFIFFSFFLHSSPISPEFFLSFVDLA